MDYRRTTGCLRPALLHVPSEQRARSVTPFEPPYVADCQGLPNINMKYKHPRTPFYTWTGPHEILAYGPAPVWEKDFVETQETRYYCNKHDVTDYFAGDRSRQHDLVWDDTIGLWRFPYGVEETSGWVDFSTFDDLNLRPVERVPMGFLQKLFRDALRVPEQQFNDLTNNKWGDVEMVPAIKPENFDFARSDLECCQMEVSEDPLSVTPTRRSVGLPAMDENDGQSTTLVSLRRSPRKSRQPVKFTSTDFDRRTGGSRLGFPSSPFQKNPPSHANPSKRVSGDLLSELPQVQMPCTPTKKTTRPEWLGPGSNLDRHAFLTGDEIDDELPIAVRRPPRSAAKPPSSAKPPSRR